MSVCLQRQFAHRANKSTEDIVSLVPHTALSHLEGRGTYVRLLFVDYSSTFNTVVPSWLDGKLQHLDLNASLYAWTA